MKRSLTSTAMSRVLLMVIITTIASCVATSPAKAQSAAPAARPIKVAIDPDPPTLGEEYVLIDKTAQILYFKKHEEKGETIIAKSPCGTSKEKGDKVVETKNGHYRVQAKFGEKHMSGEFNVPMPWACTLYDGVKFHGSYGFVKQDGVEHGTLQSHGCIRLPVEFAKWLNEHVKVGTKVIIEGSSNDFIHKTDTVVSSLYNVDSQGNYSLKILTDPSKENIALARKAAKEGKLLTKGPKGSPEKCMVGMPYLPTSALVPLPIFRDLILTDEEKRAGGWIKRR